VSRGETAGTRLPRVTRQRDTANGAALNITALVSCPGKQSRCPASQRSEKRSIGCSFMPTPPQSQQDFAGSRFPAQSRQRKPTILTPRRQSVGRGLRRDGNMGALGRPARSLPPWCQTNLVLPVSSAISVRRNAACEMEAVRKWPISRLLLMSCTGRSLAVLLLVLGDRRSLAPYCCCLAREQRLAGYCLLAGRSHAAILLFRARTICFLTVSTVCGRRNAMERKCRCEPHWRPPKLK
jgi:hypothetical protein